MKYKICKLEKSEFPNKLKNINKSPEQLYFMGNIKLLYEDSFAVIGTTLAKDTVAQQIV